MSANGLIMDSPSLMLEKLENIKELDALERVDGCVPFSHQVAGHKNGLNNTGVLQHPDGTILKHLQPPPRGPREMLFYKQVYDKDCTDVRLLVLQKHLPKFYGTWAPRESPHELYLKLENVTRRFLRPCIMDVKIGRRSYDPFASHEKREQQIKKYPLMEEIGFLLLGMRVYQINSESYITYDQLYGRSLGKETVENGLTTFFHNGKDIRRDAISLIISKIKSILRWFESQTQLHFYASSLLLVYEGSAHRVNGMKHRRVETDSQYNHGSLTRSGRTHSEPYCTDLSLSERNINGTRGGSVEDCENVGMKHQKEVGLEEGVEVKMIDFAHVFPSDGPDESYMYGLRNLLSNLEQILKN
ncbi:Inositol polyphosphate multikinase [Triplophysa tibetana]|uniref:Kinase n=1 Tax=Triplophysa tibetana TaxID=1572043 RepID=A0A5A9P9B3_9TELE|nr:Inositol polyphosphate multikinase [Triplophysa tibetana]